MPGRASAMNISRARRHIGHAPGKRACVKSSPELYTYTRDRVRVLGKLYAQVSYQGQPSSWPDWW